MLKHCIPQIPYEEFYSAFVDGLDILTDVHRLLDIRVFLVLIHP